MSDNKIPTAVIKAAKSRSHLGGTLTLIGEYKGKEVYNYVYPELMTIGMPELYLWNGVNAKVIEGEKALHLLKFITSRSS